MLFSTNFTTGYYSLVYPILSLALISSFSWAAFPFWLLHRPRNGGPRRSSDFHDPVTRSGKWGWGGGDGGGKAQARDTCLRTHPFCVLPSGGTSEELSQLKLQQELFSGQRWFLKLPVPGTCRGPGCGEAHAGRAAQADGRQKTETGSRRSCILGAQMSNISPLLPATSSGCHRATEPLKDLPPPSPQHTHKP